MHLRCCVTITINVSVVVIINTPGGITIQSTIRNDHPNTARIENKKSNQQASVETDYEIALAVRGKHHPEANTPYHPSNGLCRRLRVLIRIQLRLRLRTKTGRRQGCSAERRWRHGHRTRSRGFGQRCAAATASSATTAGTGCRGRCGDVRRKSVAPQQQQIK